MRGQSDAALTLYTDGSKQGNLVGASFFDPCNNFAVQIKLSGVASIFTAEALAILEALKYAQTMNPSDLIIFSDSQSVVHSLHSILKANHFILTKIFNLICQLKTSNTNIHIIWVKGHNDNVYNDEADRLAKEAAISGPLQFFISVGDIRSHLYRHSLRSWQREFSSTSNAKVYKSIQTYIPSFSWFRSMNYPRQSLTSIIRLRLNHNSLPVHLYKIKILNSPYCSCNNLVVANANHVLLECPLTASGREAFYRSLIMAGIPLPITVSNLLCYSHRSDIIEPLIKYIYRNKIII